MLSSARWRRWTSLHARSQLLRAPFVVATLVAALAIAAPAPAQQEVQLPGCDGETLRPYCNAPNLAAHHAEGAKAEVVDEYLLGGSDDTGGPLPGDGYGYSTHWDCGTIYREQICWQSNTTSACLGASCASARSTGWASADYDGGGKIHVGVAAVCDDPGCDYDWGRVGTNLVRTCYAPNECDAQSSRYYLTGVAQTDENRHDHRTSLRMIRSLKVPILTTAAAGLLAAAASSVPYAGGEEPGFSDRAAVPENPAVHYEPAAADVISVFRRERRDAEVVPAELAQSAVLRDGVADLSSARLARPDGSARSYIMAGRNNTICQIVPQGELHCPLADHLAAVGAAPTLGWHGRTFVLDGLAIDGIPSVDVQLADGSRRAIPVNENTFTLTTNQAVSEVRWVGPSGAQRVSFDSPLISAGDRARRERHGR